MSDSVFVGVLAGAALVFAASCQAGNGNSIFGAGGAGGGGGSTSSSGKKSSAAATGTSTLSGGDIVDGGLTGSGGAGPASCDSTANQDKDGDGWTVAQGDCNDCDPNVNPGAIDVAVKAAADGGVPMPVDSDCSGKFDPPVPCDTGLAIDDNDPFNAAKAVELCKKQAPPVGGQPQKWGIKSAKWVMPDGTPANPSPNYALGHGILTAFGPNVKVQEGARMLGLSSGTARQPTDPGYSNVQGFNKNFTSGSPVGFPKESPACPGVKTGQPHDGVALEVVIHTPSNSHGFSFEFDFFTFEWPGFICSQFNDFFVAQLTPFPKGQSDGNISFDQVGNPVSVNNAFVEVCGCANGPPCTAGGKTFTCSLGDKGLTGTGFGKDTAGSDHGSTYWLQTTSPAAPASDITIRWTVYDSGDGVLDTTTLVDNWQWIAEPGVGDGPPHTDHPQK